MKGIVENINYTRYDGSTRPLGIKIIEKVDSVKTPIADGSTVIMTVNAATPIVINGVSKNDGSGSFLFPVTGLPSGAWQYDHKIQYVDGDGYTDVAITGTIQTLSPF